MFERTKQHFKKHKRDYLIGAGCFAAGVLAYAGYRKFGVNMVGLARKGLNLTINDSPMVNPVINQAEKIIVKQNITANFGGYAHKIVEHLENGDIFKTVKDSAKDAGVSVSKMSKHLNGHLESINGQHYRIIGLATGLLGPDQDNYSLVA